MFCQKCGTENDASANFCKNCSQAFSSAVVSSTQPKKKIKPLKMVFMGILGLLFVFILLVVFSPDEASPSVIAEEQPAVAQAELPTLETLVNMDVFDWNRFSTDEQNNVAFAIQLNWSISGITGEAVDISSKDLALKISERMSDQANVFEEACDLYEIDPTPFKEMVGQ